MMQRGMILIPTFRRPGGLAKALACLDKLQTTADITILVAENDPLGREGSEVVGLHAQRSRFKIQSIEVAQRGVSHVRNFLIATALVTPGVEFVAFMDDDEWPEPQWLQALLDMQHRTDAEIVGGTVLPAFVSEPPVWAKQLKLFRQEQPDGPADMVWGTCNVLLTRALLQRVVVPWFDPRFGLTGGEDMEFFTRAKAAGAKFAWAAAALMHEDVPASRTRLGWVFRRSFRIGGTNALVQLRWKYGRFGHPIILAKSLGRLAAAFFMALRDPCHAGHRAEAFSLAARSLGEMAALVGIRLREYGAPLSSNTYPSGRGTQTTSATAFAAKRETHAGTQPRDRVAPRYDTMPYESRKP
jgi:succinoglycan biosynthesis protein ExoM